MIFNSVIAPMNQEYKIITTEDSTPSLFSGEYQEAMHSVSGAYDEAICKHILPSSILDSGRRELSVLDVGSGIGYNILALLFEFSKKKLPQKLKIISLEKDFSFLPLMENISFGDRRDDIYAVIKEAFKKGNYNYDNYEIQIRRGDARQTISSIKNISFDAAFHDPYSPAKNPELWTVQFFMEVRRVTAAHGVLTTYSSAPQVRSALLEAGFRIGRGPSVGKKREGTLASVSGNIPCMSDEEISELRNNIKSVPYQDHDFKATREQILQKRIDEMRLLRTGSSLKTADC